MLATLFAAAALFAVLLAVGPEHLWAQFGPADLGPVAFETLARSSTPNDALACPAGLCKASSDVISPEFPIGAVDLRKAFGKAIAGEPRLALVASDEAGLTDRYVQRSRLMGFPDTIVVRFFERPDGRSAIALYSRSQLGKSDLGVNRARIERWLAELETYAKAAN